MNVLLGLLYRSLSMGKFSRMVLCLFNLIGIDVNLKDVELFMS